MGQFRFQIIGFGVDLMGGLQRFGLDVAGQAQVLRRDEHKAVALKLAQRSGQGVDRPAELESPQKPMVK